MTLTTPYSASNPDTFVGFPGTFFELRSEDNADVVDLCNTESVGQTSFFAFVYTGGSGSSTAEARQRLTLQPATCTPVDYNGSDTTTVGDFRIMVPHERLTIFGASQFGSGKFLEILAIQS
jgi:hypothetical protein